MATFYVDENATGTGDGSSKANGYTTVQAAIDAEIPATIDDDYEFVLYNSVGPIAVDGYFGSDFTLTFRGGDPDSEPAVVATTNGNAIFAGGAGSCAMVFQDLTAQVTTVNGDYQSVVYANGQSAGASITIRNCTIQGADDATYNQQGLRLRDTDTAFVVENTVVYDISTTQGASQCSPCFVDDSLSALLVNCVFVGGTYSVHQDSGTVTVVNCCLIDPSDSVSTGTVGGNNNATTEASGIGTSNPTEVDFTGYFTNAAAGDYSITSSATSLIDDGIGPGSDANVPTTDAAGTTRSGTTCDIGAYEYVAAGGTNAPTGNLHGPLSGPMGGVA